jgi:hypothetical protein
MSLVSHREAPFLVLALTLTDAFWRQTHTRTAAEPVVIASAPSSLAMNGLAYLE